MVRIHSPNEGRRKCRPRFRQGEITAARAHRMAERRRRWSFASQNAPAIPLDHDRIKSIFKNAPHSPTEHDVQSQQMSTKTALSDKQRISFVNQDVALSQKVPLNDVESSTEIALSDEFFYPVSTMVLDSNPILAITQGYNHACLIPGISASIIHLLFSRKSD